MIVTRLRDEQGGVLLITALAMLALVLIVAFVVDVGNWKEHKRHLQLQADAAALAGAGSFAVPACNDTLVANAARDYAGSDATYLAKYNDQVASKYDGAGHVPNMHILINSIGYYGDTGAGDNTGGSPCATSPPNSFCNGAQGIDIKATETDLPWFFGGLVPKIHAHARVCLMQQTSSANSLPIAVPNPKPKKAAAIFVNYGSGNSVIAHAELQECNYTGCSTSPTYWSTGPTNVSIAAQTGVIIAISGRPDPDWNGNLAAICGQPLTTCFDATNDPSTDAVNFIRGWSDGSGEQPNPPVLRGVVLWQDSCTGDPYFELISANCNVTLAANVEALQEGTRDDLTGMDITVTGAGCPNKGCALTKNTDGSPPPECVAAMAGTSSGKCWRGSIPISAKAGAQRLFIHWHESRGSVTGQGDCTRGNGCNGTFPGVSQQAYTGDNLPTHNISGPLASVRVNECTGPPPATCLTPRNSFPVGPQLVDVTVGLTGALRNATSAADLTASCTFDDGSVHQFACLKVTVTNSGSGSTQSVDCDPLSNPKKQLEDELALGCSPQYELNLGTPCPSASTQRTMPQPWKCTELFTGNKTPAVSDGLNRRIYGMQNPLSCPAYGQNGHNNWDMFDPTDTDGAPGFPDDDRRLVGVYLTAYGAFTHTSGTSLTIPVTDFGHFYITGYDGSPCSTDPALNPHPDDPIPNKGTITGHFVKYVDKLNTGGGTTPCDPTSFGGCVPVMTK